jgi:hypothetical protein
MLSISLRSGRTPPWIESLHLKHHVCLCNARTGLYTSARENIERKSHEYISRICGGAPIQPVAMEVYTFVKILIVMERASLGISA